MSSTSALNSLLSSTPSNSSLDISSILAAMSGASTPGIDVSTAVNAAVAAAEAPENAWEAQQALLQSQSTALTQIQTDTTKLDNDMLSLNSLTGPLSSMYVTSSDPSIVTASVVSGSSAGSHIVVVNGLATTDSWSSNPVASASTDLPAGSFTITPAAGAAESISTGTGSTTLTDVVNQINGDNLGVTASVITDANGARLAIVSNTSGSAANFTVTSGSLAFVQSVATGAANASLTVDGIPITNASNTVTGVLPGVTLNLLNANPGSSVSLGVAPDTSAISDAINQFVTDYNTAVNELNTQFTYGAGTGQGPLASDPTVRNLQSALQNALDFTYAPATGTTTVSNLSALGISVGDDGTITVNTTTLDSVLQNNFSDVQDFLQGPALNGFASSLNQQLANFTSPANGAFTVDLQSISTQDSDLQTDITNFQNNYIVPLQTQLQSEYSQAEILLQQLPAEMQQINTELGLNNTSTS